MANYLHVAALIQEIPNCPLAPFLPFQNSSSFVYDAHWFIMNESLFLSEIISDSVEMSMVYLFGSDEPIIADWYSDTIEIEAIPTNDFYVNILSFTFFAGDIVSHKIIHKELNHRNKIKFGRYCGYYLSELIKPRHESTNVSIIEYLNAFINFLVNPDFCGQVVIPYYEINKSERELIKFMQTNGKIYFKITERYIAFVFDKSGHDFDNYDSNCDEFLRLIANILVSDFTKTHLLTRNKSVKSFAYNNRTTHYLNPDHKFAKKYTDVNLSITDPDILEECITDLIINPTTFVSEPYPFVKSFEILHCQDSIVEYRPIIELQESEFTKEYIKLFSDSFESYHGISFDQTLQCYIQNADNLYGEYLLNVKSIYSKFGKNGFQLSDSIVNERDDQLDEFENAYYGYSDFDKYNGAYGLDDDTIDTALEGDPENYWNID